MKKNKVITGMILGAAVIALFLSVAALLRHLRQYQEAAREYKNLRQYAAVSEEEAADESGSVETEAGEELSKRGIEWAALKAINKDLVGWLYIPGTTIDYPVVQGGDNEYYLKHTFSRQWNNSGSIFVDAQINDPLEAQNMILYGHNMRDGSMFAGLKKYLDGSYLSAYNTAYFYTEQETFSYQLFAAYTVAYDSDAYTYQFASADSFQRYVELVRTRAVSYQAVDIGEASKLITLSTCHGSSGTTRRCIVQGVRKEE